MIARELKTLGVLETGRVQTGAGSTKETGGTGGNGGGVDISGAISKSTVPICHIDIIPDPQDIGSTADTFISGFIKMFEGKIASTGRAITDFYADEDHGFVFVVEDRYRNAFACRIIMREHYDEQRRCVGVTRTSKSMRKMKQQKEKRSTFS